MGACLCCAKEKKTASFSYMATKLLPLDENGVDMDRPRDNPLYSPPRNEVDFSDTNVVVLQANWCRTSPYAWQEEPLLHIGSRALKWRFIAAGNEKEMLLVSMIRMATGFPIPLTKRQNIDSIRALLTGVKHANILPTISFDYSPAKDLVFIVQPFVEKGSLRDYIFNKCDPKSTYRDKYRGKGKALSENRIKKWGKQILEALVALRVKGFVFDNFHSGNVLVTDSGDVALSDLDSTILGLQLSGQTPALIGALEEHVDTDALLFGHVFYEMATGTQLKTMKPKFANLARQLPSEVIRILALIFNPPSTSTSRISNPGDGDNDDDTASATSDDVNSIISTGSSMSLQALLVDDFFSIPVEASFSAALLSSSSSSQQPAAPSKLKLTRSDKSVIRTVMSRMVFTKRNERIKQFGGAALEEEEIPMASLSTVNHDSSRSDSRKSDFKSTNSKSDDSEIKNGAAASTTAPAKRKSTKKKDTTAAAIPTPVEATTAAVTAPTTDPRIEPYLKMIRIGIPEGQVKLRMQMDGVDVSLLPSSDGGSGGQNSRPVSVEIRPPSASASSSVIPPPPAKAVPPPPPLPAAKAAVPPPPMPAAKSVAPPPPMPVAKQGLPPRAAGGRADLLSSIRGFNKNDLSDT